MLPIILVLLALTGCFRAREDPTQFYVLLPRQAQESPGAAVEPLVVSSLSIPQELNSLKIFSRTHATGVYYAQDHQWAAALRTLIHQALEAHLYGHGYLCLARAQEAPQLSIHIEDFSAGPQDSVVLSAHWTVTRETQEKHYHVRLSEVYCLSTHDYQALTQAMARALEELAKRIARSL